MNITDIQIKRCNNGRLLAYVAVVFDNSFIVRGLRLVQGDKIHLAMPDKKVKYKCENCNSLCDFDSKFCKYCGKPFTCNANGKHLDICHPIEYGFRTYLEETVIKEYMKEEKHDQSNQSNA